MRLEDLINDWLSRHPIGGVVLIVLAVIVIAKATAAPDVTGVEKMIRDERKKEERR